MNILIEQLLYFSNWKIILFVGIGLIVFYLFVGIFSNVLLSNSNLFQPHKVLNSQFNYSPQKAYDLLNSYDPKEINVLMKFIYPCDFIIAILYGIFLTIASVGIYKNIINSNYLLLIFSYPVIASICNIIENIQIVHMMQNIDKILFNTIAKTTNIFTIVKLIVLQGSLVVIIIGLLILLIKKLILIL